MTGKRLGPPKQIGALDCTGCTPRNRPLCRRRSKEGEPAGHPHRRAPLQHAGLLRRPDRRDAQHRLAGRERGPVHQLLRHHARLLAVASRASSPGATRRTRRWSPTTFRWTTTSSPSPRSCAASGYATGYAGKWHLDGSGKPQWAPERQFGFADNRFMFNRGHWKKMEDTPDGPRVAARNAQGPAELRRRGGRREVVHHRLAGRQGDRVHPSEPRQAVLLHGEHPRPARAEHGARRRTTRCTPTSKCPSRRRFTRRPSRRPSGRQRRRA